MLQIKSSSFLKCTLEKALTFSGSIISRWWNKSPKYLSVRYDDQIEKYIYFMYNDTKYNCSNGSSQYIYLLFICLLNGQVFNFTLSAFELLNGYLWVWWLDKEIKLFHVLLSSSGSSNVVIVFAGFFSRVAAVAKQRLSFLTKAYYCPVMRAGVTRPANSPTNDAIPHIHYLIFSCQSHQIYSFILYSRLASSLFQRQKRSIISHSNSSCYQEPFHSEMTIFTCFPVL